MKNKFHVSSFAPTFWPAHTKLASHRPGRVSIDTKATRLATRAIFRFPHPQIARLKGAFRTIFKKID